MRFVVPGAVSGVSFVDSDAVLVFYGFRFCSTLWFVAVFPSSRVVGAVSLGDRFCRTLVLVFVPGNVYQRAY